MLHHVAPIIGTGLITITTLLNGGGGDYNNNYNDKDNFATHTRMAVTRTVGSTHSEITYKQGNEWYVLVTDTKQNNGDFDEQKEVKRVEAPKNQREDQVIERKTTDTTTTYEVDRSYVR